MRGKRGVTRIAAFLLAFFVLATTVPLDGMNVEAAQKKVTLSKKKVSTYVGKTVKVTLKNVRSKVKWQIVSGKTVVSIKKSGKNKKMVAIKAKKVGTAKIRAIYKKKKYTIKVRVQKLVQLPEVSDNPGTGQVKPSETPSENASGKPSETPSESESGKPSETPSENESEEPSETPSESESEEPSETPSENQDEEIIEEPAPQNVVLDEYFDKIDEARSSTLGEGNEVSANLFDGNSDTKFYADEFVVNDSKVRVAWQMKRPVVLKTYTLTSASDSASYAYRDPVKWHLYGSNNATTWTQIDTVEESEIRGENKKAYTYETDVQESFQYYLMQIESNRCSDGACYKGLQFAEISMQGDVSKMSGDIGESVNAYFDSIVQDKTTIAGMNGEVPANLFDGKTGTKLCSNSDVPGSIVWKMTQPTTLYSYTLTTGNDNEKYPGRNPKAWSLYGSNDGENWEKIDRVNDGGMADENYKSYTYTVDKVRTYQYYKLDITAKNGNLVQMSEITLNGAAESTSEYNILFTGDWDLVTTPGYVDELVKLFYNSYPRLYKRWGTGTEPKTITFMADKNYDGVAYCAGTTVCVSTTYANEHPKDIGFFSHEITHSVQQYGGKLNYDESAWWTENMANYGGFRYFHWSNPEYVQIYEASDASLQDWGYHPYGNNKWFFAYMDYRYPTTRDAGGNKTLGLIDSLNKLIKENTGSEYSDDPRDTSSPFNQKVKEITGYDCIESLRLRFVEELKNGTWKFTGFGNYSDNWLTEDVAGVANPQYPMVGEKTHGDKTAAKLGTIVTGGDNLCSGAKILACSGAISDKESAAMLIDGNLDTKWCATSGDSVDGAQYKLNGVKHWVKIDLGEQKTFNTYTLYNTESKEAGYGNASEWEVLISNDGENWTSVDYQGNENSGEASFNIGNQTARYVFIKIFNPDNGVGTLRLYDFQLYNK